MNYLRTILATSFVAVIVLLLLNRCTSCHVERDVPAPDTVVVVETDTVRVVDTVRVQEPTQPRNEAAERARRIGNDGKLKITLLWNFPGDIDLHVTQPNGRTLFYRNKRDNSTGGFLDIDNTNGGRGSAENMAWQNPQSGTYKVGLVYYEKKQGAPQGGPCTVVVKRMVNGQEKIDTYTVNMTTENKNYTKRVTDVVL